MKSPGMQRLIPAALALLLCGCAAREAQPDAAGALRPGETAGISASGAAQNLDPEDKRQAQTLFETVVIPYEALAGGQVFDTPEKAPADAIGLLTLRAALEFHGTQRFLVESSDSFWPCVPEAETQQMAQALFGAVLPQGFPQNERIYYETEFRWEDYASVGEGLRGYTGSVYGTSYAEETLTPDYTVELSDTALSETGLTLTARRKAGDAALPDVTYTFEKQEPEGALRDWRPDGIWRLVSVKAEIGRERTDIASPGQLAALSAAVNAGDRTYRSAEYRLTADLDMDGVAMKPIGSRKPFSYKGDNPFNAVFDGQGHKIANLRMDLPNGHIPDDGSAMGTGLFGEVGENGVIRNLHLVNADITGEDYTGGLAGVFSGQLLNCTVQGRVTGRNEVGGMIGAVSMAENQGTEVIGCTADTQVTGSNSVGGFAGTAGYAWFEGCSAAGEMDVVLPEYDWLVAGEPGYAGGFAGMHVDGVIRNCFASVYIRTQVSSSFVGNFAGLSSYGTISASCCNAAAGGVWDPVDDDYGGFVEVETLPGEDYQKRLEAADLRSYQKDNGARGTAFNPKLYLVGAVDFPKGALGAVIHNPDEAALTRCQDYQTPTTGAGQGLLLLPLFGDTAITVYSGKLQGGAFVREYSLFTDTSPAIVPWNSVGCAVFLGTPPGEGAAYEILLEHGGRRAEYIYNGQESGETAQVYLIGK